MFADDQERPNNPRSPGDPDVRQRVERSDTKERVKLLRREPMHDDDVDRGGDTDCELRGTAGDSEGDVLDAVESDNISLRLSMNADARPTDPTSSQRLIDCWPFCCEPFFHERPPQT